MKSFIGQTLGQYHLETLLGTGGMGQVYRGVHKLLDRPAAIKVMLPNFASKPQFRARFLQEAKAAAALRHPNIVEIYEFGEQNGILYLVMELLNDGSLHSLLGQQNGQTLPLPLALDLGSQIAEGLAAAHHQQLIHRDIKPANLLLRNQPDALPGREQYLLKISDFGLARLIESNIESITATGALMGTLAYMSPEQFIPNKQIDGRADIYALGVVLYEMITGYPPFQIARITDALEKHMNVLPPPPRSIRPELPPLVEEIVLRCLAKKPEDRFASGKALSTALQNVLGNTDSGVFSVAELHSSTTRATIVSPIVTVAPLVISTMPGYSDVPRIRVLDQKGQTLQVVEVSSQGITVGRHVSNDIVLASHVISRQHLHISWDGQQVTVKDLGSSNGTILGETRLLPDATQTWEERKMIRLGSFWLRLESASASQVFTTTSMPISTAPAAARALPAPSLPKKPNFGGALSLMHERIGLSVTPKTLSIIPGQPAQIQITLTNMGPLVDWFTPTIEGVPAEWIQGAGHAIQLNPGMQESINLIINVARHPDNQAKEYPVTIRAHSRETPEDSSTTTAVWIVQTFKNEALRLEPRRASGRGKAVYSVALSNGSNTATNYTLYGDDDEQQLKYQFQRNPIELGAGQEVRIPLKVQTRRRLIGRERRVPFQLHSGPIDKPSTQTIAGEFVNQAILPAWVIPAVSALLIAGVIASKLLGIIPAFSSSIPPTPVPTSLAQITVPLAPGVTPPPLATPTSIPVPKATPVPVATPT
ncbi:MAG TPA: FHA domain-containing serine/threonine-protein kinase, partial [Ktedonobacteraceae bacterium]|nr:FHA domain-containing serine/threonine-protein kinase [Ktedonobacteraceae bacterium]